MRVLFYLFAALLLLSSCDISKSAFKEKKESESKEFIETSTKRKGDTVTWVVPNVRYKDTTIYVTNRQGSTIMTKFNDKGEVTNVDCYTSMIEHQQRQIKELTEAFKTKEKEKTEEFDASVILFVIIGFLASALLFIAMLFITKKLGLFNPIN